jgi:hypothetical protein
MCMSGQCVQGCASGTLACPPTGTATYCANIVSDDFNCGGCADATNYDNVCLPGSTCTPTMGTSGQTVGQCVCQSQNQIFCNGAGCVGAAVNDQECGPPPAPGTPATNCAAMGQICTGAKSCVPASAQILTAAGSPTGMTQPIFINLAQTNLSTAMAATDLAATVYSTSGYPASGLIKIDGETMLYKAISGNQFLSLTRNISGGAAAHGIGAAVVDVTPGVIPSGNYMFFGQAATASPGIYRVPYNPGGGPQSPTLVAGLNGVTSVGSDGSILVALSQTMVNNFCAISNIASDPVNYGTLTCFTLDNGTLSAMVAVPGSQQVYWLNVTNGEIWSASVTAGPNRVYSGLNSPQALTMDSSGNLYVANTGAGTILKFAANAGAIDFTQTPVTIASGQNNPSSIGTDSILWLYWLNAGTGASDGAVMKTPIIGGFPAVAELGGLVSPANLVVESNTFGNGQLGELDYTAGGNLFRLSVCDPSAPVPMVSGLVGPQYLYFVPQQNSLFYDESGTPNLSAIQL